jgi:hypothetical protein
LNALPFFAFLLKLILHIFRILQEALSTLTLKQKSPLENVSKCLEDALELAKRDPEEALNLRRLFLFGKKDLQSIQEADGLLIEAGVTQIFLDP